MGLGSGLPGRPAGLRLSRRWRPSRPSLASPGLSQLLSSLPLRLLEAPSQVFSGQGRGPGSSGCSREQEQSLVSWDLSLGRTARGPGGTEGQELGESVCGQAERGEGRALRPVGGGQLCFSSLNSGLWHLLFTFPPLLSPPSKASRGITRSHPACVTERSLSSLSTPWRPRPCTPPAAAPTTTSRSPTKTSSLA